jgi:hypothetical protein
VPDKSIGNECPYCGSAMTVSKMTCHRCGVGIEGPFPLPRLAALPIEHQRFIEMFVLADGSLKAIAEQTGVSYPTVRSRLDKVVEALRQEIAKTQEVKGTILDAVGEGKLSADEAARLIKGI